MEPYLDENNALSIVTGVALYFLIWWTALFVVLPFGVRTAEKGDEAVAGGAPEHPDLKRKIVITTVLSAVLWGVVYVVLRSGYFDFVQASEEMIQVDLSR